MREPIWELLVRRCGNRLVIKLDDELTLYDQYHDDDGSRVFQRLELNEKLVAGSYTNVLTFEGFNGASDPWASFNPWEFQIDILRDGIVVKKISGNGRNQQNKEVQKVWSKKIGIRLPISKN